MVCYRGWAGGRGGAGGGSRWEAGGELNPPLGLFGLAMFPRSASHSPKLSLNGVNRCLPITGVKFRPVLSM